jgi:inosine-uridine nucleoside N-ribohydrolase
MSKLEAFSEALDLPAAISAAMVDLYAAFYGHERTTAPTFIHDNVVVCVLENILTEAEDLLVAFLSANQTSPGVACELFFLDSAPIATVGDTDVSVK